MVKKDKDASAELADALKLVEKVIADPDAEPFKSPVLWKEWGILDYPDIVKEPMDLGTVRSNLLSKKYANLSQFARDVNLVWKNCMAYNADKSDYYKLAKKLERQFNREMSKLNKKHSVAGASTQGAGTAGGSKTGRGISEEDKASFCNMIYKLNDINLGKFIQTVDELYASALRKNSAVDVEVNIDALDLSAFRELEALIKKMLEAERLSKGGPVVKKKEDGTNGAAQVQTNASKSVPTSIMATNAPAPGRAVPGATPQASLPGLATTDAKRVAGTAAPEDQDRSAKRIRTEENAQVKKEDRPAAAAAAAPATAAVPASK